MKALAQVLPLYALLFVLFGKLGVKGFLLIATVVSMPLRFTYDFFAIPGYTFGGVNGIPISGADLCLAVLGVWHLASGRRALGATYRLGSPIAALIAACALSAVNTTWLKVTGFQVVSLALDSLLYYLAIRSSLAEIDDLKALVLRLNVSLLLQGAIGCAQFAMGHNFLLFSTGPGEGETIIVGDQESSGFIRVFGTVGKPNSYGDHVATLLLLSLATGRLGLCSTWLRRMALCLGSLGLLFSFSRGAWLGAVVAMISYTIILHRWREVSFRKVVMSAGAVLLFLGPFVGLMLTRFTADDHNAAMSRLPLIGVAWNMIRAHPFLGVGANTSRTVVKYFLPPDYPFTYVDQVHNIYLTFFAECGVLGLAALLWLLWTMLRLTYAHIVRRDSSVSPTLGAALFLCEIEFLVFNTFSMGNNKLAMSTVFMLCALVAILRRAESWQAFQQASLTVSPLSGGALPSQ